jgi:hypothetical protein
LSMFASYHDFETETQLAATEGSDKWLESRAKAYTPRTSRCPTAKKTRVGNRAF